MKILHFFTDEKFFDGISNFFDTLEGVENLYYHLNEKKTFHYIKNKEKIKVFASTRSYAKAIRETDADIAYLHSLNPSMYKYILKLPKSVKVIWWAWGYDLYYPWRSCPEFISLSLYKEKTECFVKRGVTNILRNFLRSLYYYMTSYVDKKIRNNVISRINYFSPVIPIEYELMRNCKDFNAQPFMLKRGPGSGMSVCDFRYHVESSNILLGNSLTPSNNHLDIWEKVKCCKRTSSQCFIIPISYGSGIDKNIVKESIKGENIIWLEKFIPKFKYKELFQSVTHAVFGVIRQQAMGNIFECLRNGIKVFLYRDSIVYQSLINSGYIVYAIEDMNENSFVLPLDKESAIHNCHLEYARSGNNKKYAESELERILTIQ